MAILDAFLGAFESALADSNANRGDPFEQRSLEAWLAAAVSSATAAYPAITLEPDVFARHLARAVASLPTPGAFQALRTTDVYLAAGCAARDPAALRVFEETLAPVARRALERTSARGDVADDLFSSLREKLLFGVEGTEPMFLEYQGRGDLKSWMRSVVVHASLNVRRREHKQATLDEDALVAPEDPELAYLKRTYGPAFEAALGESMAELPARQRTVLRQRYLDDLNIDALGALYGVHRATVARWIADACETLLVRVRALLVQRLHLRESELESVLRIGRSDLDATLSRLLEVR